MSGFKEVRLEVYKVRKGYVQDEKEVVVFKGRKLYEGTDFRGPCTVYLKEDGKLVFHHEEWNKMICTVYDDLNEAAKARRNGYPVHDQSAILGAAEALGVNLDPEERHI